MFAQTIRKPQLYYNFFSETIPLHQFCYSDRQRCMSYLEYVYENFELAKGVEMISPVIVSKTLAVRTNY